jgi:UDP-N-acetylmuramate dehydrogenase
MSSKTDLLSLARERGLTAKVLLDEPLSKHTSYRIGGPADLFTAVEDTVQLCGWVALAREVEQPFLVMGNGTNLLVADRGYRGLVIRNQCLDYTMDPASHAARAEAGIILARLARQSAEAGSAGLEWAIGIPGTVGGAIVNNAGAHDGEMAAVISRVQIMDRQGQTCSLAPGDLKLGYRTSRFRAQTSRQEIILSADLQLVPESTSILKERMEEYRALRRSRQPTEPSAGSVFKNPPGSKAGQLIDQAGLRGSRVGGAQISNKHANYIVNTGRARAEDVLQLIDLAKDRVRQLFGIDLELEIQLVGDWGESQAS